MTLHENGGAEAAWVARVVATFVVFGGFIGGGVVGIGFPLIAIATQWPPRFDPAWIVQLLFFAVFAGAYGIAIGLPASVLTSLAYLVGGNSMRLRWRLTAFGVAASAAWGALLADLMSSLPTPLENYVTMAAIFAVCGTCATIACFWLLIRWKLHRPV